MLLAVFVGVAAGCFACGIFVGYQAGHVAGFETLARLIRDALNRQSTHP